MKPFENRVSKDERLQDPFDDRRSGEDRRTAYDLDYFLNSGTERRANSERRQPDERRGSCLRVSQWSSVCPDEEI
jgi:hypothetical protein